MTKTPANLQITWPLFEEARENCEPIPAQPIQEVKAYAPASESLRALYEGAPLDPAEEQREEQQAARVSQQMRASLPPSAPDWMRAARTLADALEALIRRGEAEPLELSHVARAWAAWSLGGVTENQVLRVAHLASRTHAALRSKPPPGPTAEDIRAAAGVLRQGLPSALRERMPLARIELLVSELPREPDTWVAVVEATAELVGWKHYARVHAASAIRAIMERGGKHVEP